MKSEEEEKMEIDEGNTLPSKLSLENVEEMIKKKTSERIALFALDSKLCMAMVLGFAFNWDRAIRFFKLISKKG